MTKLSPIYLLLFVFLTFACSKTATSQTENSNDKSNTTTVKQTGNKQSSELQKQIEQIAAAAQGRVGVAAVLLETGETVSLNSVERFPMQSVYKFPIAMAVLQQIDLGKITLEQKVRVEKKDFVREGMRSPLRDTNPNGVDVSVAELLRLAVSESDGTASDVLLETIGVETAGKFLDEIGAKDIKILDSEKVIGRDWETQYRNWATPDGAITLLRALHERRGISEASQKLLIKLMTETPTGMKRLKGMLPKGTVVVHKTGTSGTRDGITAATNDIGIITLPAGKHLAIAVFVSDSKADEKTREETIARIAKAVWDKWSQTK